MKEIYAKTNNFTKRDEFNIKAGAKALKDVVNQDLTVVAACTGADIDMNGEKVNAGALVADEGIAYTTISRTAIDLIDSLIEIMNEDNLDSVKVHVTLKKSKSERDYIVFTII